MESLLSRVKKEVLIMDGAMGTMLQEAGLAPGGLPEAWNRERPEAVLAVHRAYIEAGSDIILTNTFGANRLKLARANQGDKSGEYNLAAVEIARKAAAGRAYVLGDVGPTGEFLEPLGTLAYEEAVEVFAGQIRSLVKGGVDGIIIETISDLGELKAAAAAARENSSLPVLAAMCFGPAAGGDFRTMMGTGIPEMVAEMHRLGCHLLGANCGALEIAQMAEIVGRFREEAKKFAGAEFVFFAEPNAGVPRLRAGKTVFPETPESMAGKIRGVRDAGARIIGGCCGTTPAHIRALAAAVKDR